MTYKQIQFGDNETDNAEKGKFVVYRFSHLATQMNRVISTAYVKKFGRPLHGWKILTTLSRFGDLSPSDLDNYTTLEMDKITRIIDSLVEKELIIREQNNVDRRRVVVSLSPKGTKVARQIREMIADMEREFLLIFDKSERDTFCDLLERLQPQANEIFKAKDKWKIGN